MRGLREDGGGGGELAAGGGGRGRGGELSWQPPVGKGGASLSHVDTKTVEPHPPFKAPRHCSWALFIDTHTHRPRRPGLPITHTPQDGGGSAGGACW